MKSNKELRLERYQQELKELYRKVNRKLDQIARIKGVSEKKYYCKDCGILKGKDSKCWCLG